jgi:hypothetical protein
MLTGFLVKLESVNASLRLIVVDAIISFEESKSRSYN